MFDVSHLEIDYKGGQLLPEAKSMENTQNQVSPEALFRYQVISQVLVRERNGEFRAQAVQAVASISHINPYGQLQKVSQRSIYRWVAAFEAQGFAGLLSKERVRRQDSLVIDQPMLDFFKIQKTADPQVSVPELIRRAKQLGMIKANEQISRVTVWRTLNRMGIDTTHRKAPANRDCRRFAYPHRMDMVLCDGKHFRAGLGRLRRVALFFLDDATRKALGVVVGTSENAKLFLRGLYELIKTYGIMLSFYVDNGPGFIADDAIDVMRKLGILFIHGSAGYPQGHGKLERFNRTAFDQAIRFFDANSEIDPNCSSLELRLRHYLFEQYDHTPHESLESNTPWYRFHNDERPLRFHQNEHQLRQAFVLHEGRRVSNDNVVSLNSVHKAPLLRWSQRGRKRRLRSDSGALRIELSRFVKAGVRWRNVRVDGPRLRALGEPAFSIEGVGLPGPYLLPAGYPYRSW